MNDLTGKTLGQYQIREKIGQGGMAQVFKAYQPGLDRFVAVKVLSPALTDEPGFIERFQREAHSAARLHHPHILEVYDYGVQGDYTYLVMRYVENSRTLGDLIQEEAPLARLIDHILQVADALNYAHERGVIHRDVKPSNILIDGRWALLADFGLAKISQSSSQLTGTGVGIGTPAYMSPEQASGASLVDHRTDIYALGVILYRILTGTVPHDAPTPFAILAKRCTEPVRPPREINPEVPESLGHVVLRSLAPLPDSRYGTANQFADALKKAEEDPDYREDLVTTLAGPDVQTATFDRVSGAADITIAEGAAARRNWGLIVGGAVAAVAIGVALIFLLSYLLLRGGGLLGRPTVQAETPESAGLSTPVSVAEVSASPTPVPPGTPSAIAKTDLEVWSGPGENYELLGYLPEGVSVKITGRDKAGQWWQITTSLGTTGSGWIRAGSDFSEATDAVNVPVPLPPPTPTTTPVPDTPTPSTIPIADTPTPSATPLPDTPTSTATPTPPTPTATPRAPASPTAPTVPTATRVSTSPDGQFTLLKPASLAEPSTGPTEFEWQWDGPLGAGQGFEVRVWREGEPQAGVHDAVADNKSGKVAAVGGNTYRLNVDIRDAAGVQGRSGEYLWTVVLVQIDPEYEDLGKQATPGRLRFEVGGEGGDGGDGGPKPTY